MKEIFGYLRQYFKDGNKKVWVLTTLLVSLLISLNYTIGIESAIRNYQSFWVRLVAFFSLYAFVFTTCYGIQFLLSGKVIPYKKEFFSLLLLCPFLFAVKISFDISYFFGDSVTVYPWNKFLRLVFNWPIKCILMLAAIYGIWLWGKYKKPVAGMNGNFNWKPYLLLLLCSIPLLAIAGTMNDFQHTYPKVKNISFIYSYTHHDFFYTLLYELSYGTDFLTIESFFRGLVVLAFVRYVGKDAILPMAAFYCTIHFGKPLFECITSYIGGILLGVIVYNTRSIWGGLIVHLGLAWLMELFLR
ncbi:MAG: CPBP family intramembrane metalloprotease [Chitinophagaceae bacterium]|nr:CPBP family intramembrane metalloprotease [Chitinophagaceae bacterium]